MSERPPSTATDCARHRGAVIWLACAALATLLVADGAQAQQPADELPTLEPPGTVLPPAPDAPSAAGAPAAAVAPTPTSVAPATAGATDAYAGFRAQFDAGRYSEAVPYATRVLELAEQQAAQPAAEEVQVALMNLGLVQNLSGDYVGAEATFLRVLELIAASGRPLYTRQARAYGGLASAYHDGKRHDLAVESFDQAIALVRRHVGLLTEQQVPLIEKYIDSLTELGRYEDALKAQKYVLRIATRAHGERGVGIVPTLEQIGRWYASIGAYDQSRRTLKQAIEIVEDAESEKSPRLVGPLLALAACNRRQMLDPAQQAQAAPDPERRSVFEDPKALAPSGYSLAMMATEGEESLLRAAAIIDGQAQPSPVQIVNVRTQVGDWYQLRAQDQRALPHYQQAWQAAARITDRIDGKSYTEALFGQPVLLHLNRPESWNRYRTRPASEVEIRSVVVEFTVNDKGRVESPRVVDDSGDAKRGERTAAALASTARYRPRFENGRPVTATGVNFSQPWILLLPPPATAPQGVTTAPASPTESAAPTTGSARPESAT